MNSWHVKITEDGREGAVIYTEPAGSLSFPWEFSGGNIVASVFVGTEADWSRRHAWATARRQEILQRVAAEVVRQKSPNSIARMDETSGWLNICQAPASQTIPQTRQAAAAASHQAFRDRKARLSLILGAIVVAIALAAGTFKSLFSIEVTSGTPIGPSIRTATHIATLIQTLEPYVPSLHRNADNDRYSLSLFLYPLDGNSTGESITIAKGLGVRDFNLLTLLGSDNDLVWFNWNGTGAVNVRTGKVLSESELSNARPPAETAGSNSISSLGVELQDFLSPGVRPQSAEWFGLHSVAEAAQEYKPGARLSRNNLAQHANQARRLYRAQLGPEMDRGYREILSLTSVTDAEFLNAAFVRTAANAEPLRLQDPDSFMMAFTSAPGLAGTLMLARVDTTGAILWQTDTGIDRFKLDQILPGATRSAFIGTRPPVPGKVPEPILVIVDNQSGNLSTSSLWQ